MEVAAGLAASSSSSCFPHVTPAKAGVSFRRRRNGNNHRFVVDSSSYSAAAAALEFRDNGHLQYYYVKCGGGGGGSGVISNNKKSKEKLSIKKTSKLIKSLSKDLTLFSHNSDHNGLLDHNQATLLQETAQGLMNQLQELRAKEKELKMQKKQAKLASRNRVKMDSESSSESSSSSSESSNSDREVINMRHLRNGAVPVAEPTLPEIIHQLTHQHVENPPSTSDGHLRNGAVSVADPMLPEIIHQLTHQHVDNPASTSESHLTSVCCGAGTGGGGSSTKRIEVCMGGKCKKSGGAALLEEFQRVLGVEGAAVVGCKCMGKCRDGPNVRVASLEDTIAPKPLCIGVGLEDIDVIVAKFFGEDHNTLALAPVS
ncbi:diacylglycerol O-acyltransferase 3 [Mercurialis annua]|uniref:diacylglycerol O-acyltransferase 3 n=1 Tax=Mercurialis annua TaxID=3986 RepID=UPI00215E4E66|nr:diacylglycerol O-acyltransferase 3 [Mercurialis annua]